MNSVPSRLTYCKIDGNLVRVWGIVDCERWDKINKILEMNNDRLAQSTAYPMSTADLVPGSTVLVKQDRLFRRASIIRQVPPSERFLVYFIDVGNTDAVLKNDMRMLSAFPDLKELDEDPCATDYILSNALIGSSSQSANILDVVNFDSMYQNHIKIIGTVAGKTLISFLADHTPFYTHLAKRGYAINYASLATVKAAVVQHGPFSSPIALSKPSAQQLEVPKVAPLPAIRSQPLRVHRLLVGTLHKVHVSHVIDGAQSFMIQLKETLDSGKLINLLRKLNDSSIHHEPIELCYVGVECLARYSDGPLCRAVMSKVLTDGADLLFVDLGITKTVPFSQIYKLPAQFFEEPIMALPFTLASVSTNSALRTEKARKMFEELAEGADHLLLRVTEPEIPGKQYCKLYICDDEGAKVDIKQKILDEVNPVKPVVYNRLTFKPNCSNNVRITHTETPVRFFVRLTANLPLLKTLMDSFEEYCDRSPLKNISTIEEVHANMAVWLPSCNGGESSWLRGLIVGEPMDDGYVDVLDVDTGHQETVHFSKLRVMINGLFTRLPMQGVECRLDIDADSALKEEVVTAFNEMVHGHSYKMKVIDVLPENILLVNLFEGDQNVKDVLLSKFETVDPIIPLPSNPPESAASQSTDGERVEGQVRDNQGAETNVNQRVPDEEKPTIPVKYKKLSFEPNIIHQVELNYVESAIRFHVLLEGSKKRMRDIMDLYLEHSGTSTLKGFSKIEDVHENMAVLCTNFSSYSRRCLTAGKPKDNGCVSVFWVDYGFKTNVPISQLRILNDEFLSKIPMQAIECRLDVNVDFALRAEVVDVFKDVARPSSYRMKVINVLPENVLLVDLFDREDTSLKEKLLNRLADRYPMILLASNIPEAASSQRTGVQEDRDNQGTQTNVTQNTLNKEKFVKSVEYKKLSFEPNSSNDVQVSHVESPLLFFVQLQMHPSLLEIEMVAFQKFCASSTMKKFSNIEEVNENMAVCCQYRGNSQWQRALVVEKSVNDGNVVVFYVDYGNKETVHFSELGIMSKTFSLLPMQAVECRLDVDASFALRDEVATGFLHMAHLNSYKLKVISVLPANVFIVDLFDKEGRNMKYVLLSVFGVIDLMSEESNSAGSTASQISDDSSPEASESRCLVTSALSASASEPSPSGASENSASEIAEVSAGVECFDSRIPHNQVAKTDAKQKEPKNLQLVKPAEYQRLSFEPNRSGVVVISHIRSPLRFFVRLQANALALEESNAYASHQAWERKSFSRVEEVVDNMAVCCQYRGNPQWLRAVVIGKSMHDGNVVVFYVDYGYTDDVHFSRLRATTNEIISKLPMQAIECRLDVDPMFARRKEVLNYFVHLAKMKYFKMKVIDVSPANILIVDLLDEEGQNTRNMVLRRFGGMKPVLPLIPAESGTWPRIGVERHAGPICDNPRANTNVTQNVVDNVPLMKPAEYRKLSFVPNTWHRVFVSYVESLRRFFVQLQVYQPSLDILTTSLQQYSATTQMADDVIDESLAVCCQYSGDNKWYRGLIEGFTIEELSAHVRVEVFYVDYGNKETVPLSKIQILKGDMVSKLPMQAVKCRLALDSDFVYGEEMIEAFVQMVDMKSFKMKVISVSPDEALIVDLFDEEGQNVKNVLLSVFGVGKPNRSLACGPPKPATS